MKNGELARLPSFLSPFHEWHIDSVMALYPFLSVSLAWALGIHTQIENTKEKGTYTKEHIVE